MNDEVGDNGDFVGGEGASVHPRTFRHSCFRTRVSQSDEPCPNLSREQPTLLRMPSLYPLMRRLAVTI